MILKLASLPDWKMNHLNLFEVGKPYVILDEVGNCFKIVIAKKDAYDHYLILKSRFEAT